MPVSPQQVQQAVDNYIDQEKLNEAIAKIDKELSDPVMAANTVCNKQVNPTYRFGFRGTVTAAEKERMIQLYTEAGWGLVTVQNSEENGERSGMWGLTLYTAAD